MGLDNLNDYYSPARKRANLDEIVRTTPAGSTFTSHEGDVRDVAWLHALASGRGIDAIVHLAAMAGVGASVKDPHLYYDVNLIGTLNLLDLARDVGIGQFVLASTSSVYGDTKKIPFEESDACDRPLAPYPASKRAAEMLVYAYHHLYSQSATVLRFFTVYGPRGRPDMMAYKVLDNIFYGKPVPLYNEGQMYRDWTYVADIASGIVAAAERPLGYEVINLGRGEPVLLADFVRLVESQAGHKAHLQSAPKPPADIDYTYADITRARRLLGYDPKTSVDEGVARFWEWYRDNVLR